MYVFIFIFGLLIGSFLNVCIYRIPNNKSIVYPSSHCPNCHTSLKSIDLIPILSYLFYRGKCRYCSSKISMRYPFFELLTGLVFLFLYSKLGLTVDFIAYSLLSSMLIAISGIDFDHQIIPDEIVIFGFIIGVIYIIYDYYVDISSISLLSRFGGFLIGGGLFLLIAILSNGGMGGGDIKLMAMLGFWLGMQGILLVTLLSFIIGAIISVFLLAAKIKGRKEAIPFGPFITIAAFITICFRNEMISWYLQRFM